jgi:transposase
MGRWQAGVERDNNHQYQFLTLARRPGSLRAAQDPYNRWKRWSEKGIFARMMAGLAAEHGEEKTVMIDATYLNAHRTATSVAAKKGGVDG